MCVWGGGGYQSPVIVRKRVIDQAGEESRETEQNLYHSPCRRSKQTAADRGGVGCGVRGAGGVYLCVGWVGGGG